MGSAFFWNGINDLPLFCLKQCLDGGYWSRTDHRALFCSNLSDGLRFSACLYSTSPAGREEEIQCRLIVPSSKLI